MFIDNKNEIKFEEHYPTLDDKIIFLESIDLVNLQKAAKIGNISSSKLKDKDSAIKSILSFDFKNKFIICKNIFNNYDEYFKRKVKDIEMLKTIEFEEYKKYKMNNPKYKKIKDELTNELDIEKLQSNKDDKLHINYKYDLKFDDSESHRSNEDLENTIKKILMDSDFRNKMSRTFNFSSSRNKILSRLDRELDKEQKEHKIRMNKIWKLSNKIQENSQKKYFDIIIEELNYMNVMMSMLIKLNTHNNNLNSRYNFSTQENSFRTTQVNLNNINDIERNKRTIATTISLKIPKKEY